MKQVWLICLALIPVFVGAQEAPKVELYQANLKDFGTYVVDESLRLKRLSPEGTTAITQSASYLLLKSGQSRNTIFDLRSGASASVAMRVLDGLYVTGGRSFLSGHGTNQDYYSFDPAKNLETPLASPGGAVSANATEVAPSESYDSLAGAIFLTKMASRYWLVDLSALNAKKSVKLKIFSFGVATILTVYP